MKNLIMLGVVFMLCSVGLRKPNQSNKEYYEIIGDRCTDWQSWDLRGRESQLYIKICERESGGSGYYKFKNGNGESVRISFELTFNNGRTYKGSTNIKAYSETIGSSCYSCATKNSGVKSWSLTKISFEGEDGYW